MKTIKEVLNEDILKKIHEAIHPDLRPETAGVDDILAAIEKLNKSHTLYRFIRDDGYNRKFHGSVFMSEGRGPYIRLDVPSVNPTYMVISGEYADYVIGETIINTENQRNKNIQWYIEHDQPIPDDLKGYRNYVECLKQQQTERLLG